jgi:hypothetical protein
VRSHLAPTPLSDPLALRTLFSPPLEHALLRCTRRTRPRHIPHLVRCCLSCTMTGGVLSGCCRGNCKAQVDKYPRAEHQRFDNEADALAYLRGHAQTILSPPVAARTRVPVPAPTLNPARAPGSAAVLAIAQTDVSSDASAPGSTLCTVVYAQGVCSEHHLQDSTLSRITGAGVWFGDHDPRCVMAAADCSVTPERRAGTCGRSE